MMEFSGYVACLCEGAAEEAIIDILLDADLLRAYYLEEIQADLKL